jgi:hypothetical protein
LHLYKKLYFNLHTYLLAQIFVENEKLKRLNWHHIFKNGGAPGKSKRATSRGRRGDDEKKSIGER